MAKEINLFSQLKEEETSAPPEGPQAFQLSFPGFQESQQIKKFEREQKQMIRRVIEALLFVTNEPLTFLKLREIVETKFQVKPKLIRDVIDDLQEDCLKEQRGYRLEETAQGFIFKTCEELAPFIEQLFRNKRGEKLSQPSLEVLAIIAYKQPISRPQIESLRGVDCSGTLQNLLERELIQPVGKLDAPGKPTLYGVTSQFLIHFGLKDLKELPALQEFRQ